MKIPKFLKANSYYLPKILGLLFVIGIFMIIGWQTMDWFLPTPIEVMEMWVGF